MTRKFKVGDKVRITATMEEMRGIDIPYHDATRYADRGECVVSSVSTGKIEPLHYGVQLGDEALPWYFSEDMLELVTPEPAPECTFKVGDKVRLVSHEKNHRWQGTNANIPEGTEGVVALSVGEFALWPHVSVVFSIDSPPWLVSAEALELVEEEGEEPGYGDGDLPYGLTVAEDGSYLDWWGERYTRTSDIAEPTASTLTEQQREALRDAARNAEEDGDGVSAAAILRAAFPEAFAKPEPEPGADIPDEVVEAVGEFIMDATGDFIDGKTLRAAIAAADAKRAEMEGRA